MDFGDALRIVQNGGLVTRQCWASAGFTLGCVALPAESNITPFLALRAPDGKLTPWLPGNPELFGVDWLKVQPEREAGHA